MSKHLGAQTNEPWDTMRRWEIPAHPPAGPTPNWIKAIFFLNDAVHLGWSYVTGTKLFPATEGNERQQKRVWFTTSLLLLWRHPSSSRPVTRKIMLEATCRKYSLFSRAISLLIFVPVSLKTRERHTVQVHIISCMDNIFQVFTKTISCFIMLNIW